MLNKAMNSDLGKASSFLFQKSRHFTQTGYGGVKFRMNKFALLLLTLFDSHALACDLPLGEYRAWTESEWNIELSVLPNNEFTFIWSAYLSGVPNSTESKMFKGTYDCSNNIYTFKYPDETATATYKLSEHYPFGVFKNVKAIVFNGSMSQTTYLAGMTLWPK